MAAYDVINGYDPLRTIARGGFTFSYQMRIPAGASVATALPLYFWLHQSGKFEDDFANAAAAMTSYRADAFGVRTDAGEVDGFVVFFAIPTNSLAAKLAAYTIHRAIVEAEQARGFNINTRQINACGYSTGAIMMKHLWYRDPSLWNACAGVDGSFNSPDLTDNASNSIYATLPAGIALANPAYVPNTVSPIPDTVLFAEVAGRLLTTNIAWMETTSNRPEFDATDWGRRLNDYSPLITALNAASPGVARESVANSSTTMDVLTTDRFCLREMNDLDHSSIANVPFNATHWPAIRAWFNARALPAPSAVGPTARGRRLSGMLL